MLHVTTSETEIKKVLAAKKLYISCKKFLRSRGYT